MTAPPGPAHPALGGESGTTSPPAASQPTSLSVMSTPTTEAADPADSTPGGGAGKPNAGPPASESSVWDSTKQSEGPTGGVSSGSTGKGPAGPAAAPQSPSSTGSGAAAGSAASTGTAASRTRTVPRRRGGTGRRARLEVSHLDTLSVLKFSAVWSVAVMIVALVAATVIYLVLSISGVLDNVEDALVEVTANAVGDSPLEGLFSLGRLLTYTLISSFVFALCMTAILTLTAILYNAAAELVGGIRVTLTDRA